ncbi:hypothetical protein CspeluHIS016_0201710 [Cutaneotrichosporon spelunceum]|uniref:RNA-binding S4 domain-containing protein n=1 Tax=Cutaneotrichosporon spelunceum TaxID=1672016 RepID=A0AAD3Y9L8_9TREE|nr:hypothetical protein CspeluHIS016_0201710 [Cutaneotrichosporon spelunceum]
MPVRPIHKRGPMSLARNIPRLSWDRENLFNIWLRTNAESPLYRETQFNRSTKTIFQQRWTAKRLMQGYHAEHMGTKKFQRWFLPEILPTVRHGDEVKKTNDLAKWVEGKEKAGGRTIAEKLMAETAEAARSPVGSLMWSEVERRLDVLIFRACFATSVWQARSYITQGHVKVNGYVVRNANVQLKPGDIFSINPSAIPMLRKVDHDQKPRWRKFVSTADAQAQAQAVKAAGAAVAAEVEAAEGAEGASAEASEGAEAAAEGEAAVQAEAEAEAEPTEKKSFKEVKAEKRAARTADEDKGTYFYLPEYASPHIFVPAYILPSFLTCSAVYVRHPTARPGYSEIPTPYDADGPLQSLTWEWFQQVAPRMKPKRRARLMNPQRTQDRRP